MNRDEWNGEPLSNESLADAHGGVLLPSCGVAEEEFPRLGTCCARDGGNPGAGYRKICPDCSVWTSFPEGTRLTTAHIIECCRYGYGRRIKE